MKRPLATFVLLGTAIVATIGAVAWRQQVTPVSLSDLRRGEASPGSEYMMLAGIRTHVVDEGEGPAVLMLHGNENSLRLWDGWAKALTQRGFRVLRFDLPSYGLSQALPAGEQGIAMTHAMIGALLDQRDIDRVVIVGAANGGPPAAWYASNHPAHVAGLALINAPFQPPRNGFSDMFARQRWLADTLYDRLGRPRPGTSAYVARLVGAHWQTPGFARFASHIHALGRHKGPGIGLPAYGSSFAMPANPANPAGQSNAAMLRQLTLPVLVQWGSDSLLRPEEADILVIAMPAASVERRIYEGAGHWFPAGDHPDALADLIGFVESSHRGGEVAG